MKHLIITEKGERLIASKFGIPYGLFLAIYSRYGLWVVLIGSIAAGILIKSYWTGLGVTQIIWFSWYFAYQFSHPRKANK